MDMYDIILLGDFNRESINMSKYPWSNNELRSGFCHVCGTALVKDHLLLHSPKTGEGIYTYKCPTNLCNHVGARHKYVRKYIWSDKKCVKCGHVMCDTGCD